MAKKKEMSSRISILIKVYLVDGFRDYLTARMPYHLNF